MGRKTNDTAKRREKAVPIGALMAYAVEAYAQNAKGTPRISPGQVKGFADAYREAYEKAHKEKPQVPSVDIRSIEQAAQRIRLTSRGKQEAVFYVENFPGRGKTLSATQCMPEYKDKVCKNISDNVGRALSDALRNARK